MPTTTTHHTPGPWSVIERLSDTQSGTDVYVGLPDRRVAQVFDGAYDRNANARLIAAAPELLAALEQISVILDQVPVTQRTGDLVDDAQTIARAAIRKATGDA